MKLVETTENHFLGNLKEYLAAMSVSVSALLVWVIETLYTVKVPPEIVIVIGTLLAGLGAKVANNAKSKPKLRRIGKHSV